MPKAMGGAIRVASTQSDRSRSERKPARDSA
jgi:hypothetical protein